jgi:hypothetical protein
MHLILAGCAPATRKAEAGLVYQETSWHPISGGEAIVVEAHQGDDFADTGLLANSAGGELRLAGKHRMVDDPSLFLQFDSHLPFGKEKCAT